MKEPSAWLPIALSVAALGLVLGSVGLFGATREPDEGTTAHVWQLLMGVQLPAVAFFAAKWLRQAPRQTLQVIALQAVAALAAIAPVWFFKL